MTTATCPTCARPVVRIGLVKDGRDVEMRSCSRCDTRWWTVDGLPADPTEVLAHSSL